MIRTDVRLGWKSIPGHRHLVEGRENEDAVFVSHEHPYFDAVMLLADGLGGHAEPRLAAQTAIRAARDYLFQPERVDELSHQQVDPSVIVRRALETANRHVRSLAARVDPARGEAGGRQRGAPSAPVAAGKEPASTLTVAVVANGRVVVAHVGDGSVFLRRDGRLRSLAGGEDRRFGTRPELYLGRDDALEMETTADTVREGDRVLLCTDGLTRYFGDNASPPGTVPRSQAPSDTVNGLERLDQVVARPSADPQTLATQLTADGRGEQYEDDTTVIVAEIGASREAPDPQPAAKESGREGTMTGRQEAAGFARSASRSAARARARSSLVPYALALVALAAVALVWWRPWQRGSGRAPGTLRPFNPPPVDLSGLPQGGVLLVHPESGRLFVVRTRPVGTPSADEVLTLRELRYQSGRPTLDTGNTYRLDPRRGRLTGPTGRSYPVTVDGGSGVIELQQAGALRIETQPEGLPVLIDGLAAGPSPVKARLRPGRHQVQVRERGARRRVLYDEPVEVPARTSVTITVPPAVASPGASRAAR